MVSSAFGDPTSVITIASWGSNTSRHRPASQCAPSLMSWNCIWYYILWFVRMMSALCTQIGSTLQVLDGGSQCWYPGEGLDSHHSALQKNLDQLLFGVDCCTCIAGRCGGQHLQLQPGHAHGSPDLFDAFNLSFSSISLDYLHKFWSSWSIFKFVENSSWIGLRRLRR